MPQISERRRMQNRIAQRKFRDKKQQQQLQIQQQQQQQQQQHEQQQQEHQELRQRPRTNSYLSQPSVSSPSRRKSSVHENQHTRPLLNHTPPHGLPLQMPESVFSIPDYSLSTYGSEFDDLLSPDDLSCFSTTDECSYSDHLDLELQHFALSSPSVAHSMAQGPYGEFPFPDTTYFGDMKPCSTANSSHRPSFSHHPSLSGETQFGMPMNSYYYPRKQSIATSCSYNSSGSAWSNFSAATTETAVTTPSVVPDSYQACYFSAASVPIAEPKASSQDTPNFLRSWSGITSPPQQDMEWKPLLHVSAERGRDNIVRTLIQQGANVNELDSRGFTALQLAMQNGHQQTVRLLLESGADMNATAGPMWGPFNGTSLDPLEEDLSNMFGL